MASPTYTTVSHGSMEVTSNTSSEEQIREALEFPTEKEEASEAAAKLGKRGGKAAAEARKAKDEEAEAPEPEKAKAPEKEAKPEKAEEKPEQPSKKGNPRHDPEARKAEISSEIRELTTEQKRLRAENERLSKELEAKAPKPTPKPQPSQGDDDAPDWSRYEAEGKDFPTFLRDHTAHAVKQALQKDRAEQAARSAHEQKVLAGRQFITTFEGRMNAYAEKNGMDGKQFQDSLDQELLAIPPRRFLPDGQVRGENFLAEEINDSEKAPELWVHFSEHRNEFQRLATLKPLEIIRGIARLEATLGSQKAAATAGTSAPKAPEVSQAKPPVRPVTGSPHTAEDDDDTESLLKLPVNEYVRRMNAKERRALR